MDISNINGISTGDIKSFFNNTSLTKTDKTDSFSDVLSAAMGSIGETNDLQNADLIRSGKWTGFQEQSDKDKGK